MLNMGQGAPKEQYLHNNLLQCILQRQHLKVAQLDLVIDLDQRSLPLVSTNQLLRFDSVTASGRRVAGSPGSEARLLNGTSVALAFGLFSLVSFAASGAGIAECGSF